MLVRYIFLRKVLLTSGVQSGGENLGLCGLGCSHKKRLRLSLEVSLPRLDVDAWLVAPKGSFGVP